MPTPPSLNAALGHHPHHPLSYGTAGFRAPARTLPEAVLRSGILAALRSRTLNSRTVGIMVTASHNPAADNGLKLIDPTGAMLHPAWEALATTFINAPANPAQALSHLNLPPDTPASVLIGWDSRQTSPALADLARQGVAAANGTPLLLGQVTTPQLHFSLRARDRARPARLEDYYAQLRRGYARLLAGRAPTVTQLAIDCACGVAAAPLHALRDALPPAAVIVNRPADGPLNHRCGADFVQKRRQMPAVYTPPAAPNCNLWASLDGDADRLVMFAPRPGPHGGIFLADGDRFAALVARFVARHVKRAGVPGLTLAVAQTAYSNGAATEFLAGLPGVEVVVAKTGVKHLEKAVKVFDIGIYWEPNGHGTVLFSDKAVDELSDADAELVGEPAKSDRKRSLSTLLAVSQLANQAVGDGVADLLLILGILACEDMSFADWLQLYDERCSSNVVVRVADKNVITTEDCDRLVKEPEALRDAVMEASVGDGCRAFVRPSGTEDVVRIYAEAPVGCEDKANEIALQIARAVYDLCGGVGNRL